MIRVVRSGDRDMTAFLADYPQILKILEQPRTYSDVADVLDCDIRRARYVVQQLVKRGEVIELIPSLRDIRQKRFRRA